MAPPTVFRGTRAELAAALARIPAALAGRDPAAARPAELALARAGTALLGEVQRAFLVKSRGGVGSDGIKWVPLKRETVAARRTTAGERKAAGVGGRRGRGLLTPAQDKRWRQVYARTLARLRLSLGEADARARAAAAAWADAKRSGARTRLDVFGGRQVDVLRDTGELFRSLTPGYEQLGPAGPGQVFRVAPGAVVVGTAKKPWHHRGVPGRLPARPLWPVDGTIPPAWWPAVRDALARGLAAVAVELVEREGR